MLTAEQISMQTGIQVHTVRYRLTELRKSGKIKAEQYGTTYVYKESAVKKVENYPEGGK